MVTTALTSAIALEARLISENTWTIILSAAVSIIVALITTRVTIKQIYSERVSKSRMEWIDIWRENVTEFLAIAERIYNFKLSKNDQDTLTNDEKKQQDEWEYQLNVCRNRILVRVNLAEEDHLQLYNILMNMDWEKSQNFKNYKEKVLSLTRKILKPEWERYKKESGGIYE